MMIKPTNNQTDLDKILANRKKASDLEPQESKPFQSNRPKMAQAVFELPIEKIEFYERNPRSHHEMEAYNALKSSIKEIGIKQPVYVTQRPNSENYILSAGGNSRLKILKELFEETGDKKYSTITAFIEDFESDKKILIQHVIENEQRQEMSFLDKINAYHALKIDLEKIHKKTFSLRELSDLFEKEGVCVGYKLLGEVIFLKKIFSSCSAYPETLQQLSRQKYQDIRGKLNPILESAMKRGYTEEDILTKFSRSLSNEFLILISKPDMDLMELVEMALKSLMDRLKIDESEILKKDKKVVKIDPVTTMVNPPINALPQEKFKDVERPFEGHKNVVSTAISSTGNHEVGINHAANLTTENTANHSDNQNFNALPPLPNTTLEAARILADLVGLSNALKPNDKMPLGFFMEVPEDLEQEMDYDTHGVFWLIVNLTSQYTDLTELTEVKIPTYKSLPSHSLWRRFMENEETETVDNVRFMIGEDTNSNYFIQTVLTDPNHRLLQAMLNLFSMVRQFKGGKDYV